MDEQIMSWATSRPEVSKDEDNYMIVFSIPSDFKCLCICVLVSLIGSGTLGTQFMLVWMNGWL